MSLANQAVMCIGYQPKFIHSNLLKVHISYHIHIVVCIIILLTDLWTNMHILISYKLTLLVWICTYIHHVGVLNLRHTTSNTAIIITWDPIIGASNCGPVLYYTVTATSLADDKDRKTIVWGTRDEFSDLINGINYNISVAAVNKIGSGSSSTIVVTSNGRGK